MIKTEDINFVENASAIKLSHFQQNVNQINLLNKKYINHQVIGDIYIWEAIEKLAFSIDPTDKILCNTSQWIHTLQVVEAMEIDNATEEELIVAWVHDLGKILLLYGENPENVVCDNSIVFHQGEKCGLKNCLTHWNHDEFAYIILKNYIPENMSWLVRYHSIKIKECIPYMDNEDCLKLDHILKFRKYDAGTKSITHYPKLNLDKHRRLLEKWFPKKIII